jgi:hypothetical protein
MFHYIRREWGPKIMNLPTACINAQACRCTSDRFLIYQIFEEMKYDSSSILAQASFDKLQMGKDTFELIGLLENLGVRMVWCTKHQCLACSSLLMLEVWYYIFLTYCLLSIVNYLDKLFTMINQFEVNTLAHSNTILLILSTEILKHGSSSFLCQTRSIATDGKNVT